MATDDYDLYVATISDDLVATILRFHLLTEFYLEQLIRLFLPRGDRILDSDSFSYAQKLAIVAASNFVDDHLISALKNLNKVRNKCSHELNHQIGNADLERIGSPFGKEWTAIKRKYSETGARMGHLFGSISASLSVEVQSAEERFHHVRDPEPSDGGSNPERDA